MSKNVQASAEKYGDANGNISGMNRYFIVKFFCSYSQGLLSFYLHLQTVHMYVLMGNIVLEVNVIHEWFTLALMCTCYFVSVCVLWMNSCVNSWQWTKLPDAILLAYFCRSVLPTRVSCCTSVVKTWSPTRSNSWQTTPWRTWKSHWRLSLCSRSDLFVWVIWFWMIMNSFSFSVTSFVVAWLAAKTACFVRLKNLSFGY